jgi:hypothetical protein
MSQGRIKRKTPKYMKGVIAAALAQRAPGLYSLNVCHDDWCDLLNRKGACNCNPSVDQPVQHDSAESMFRTMREQ